jgi:hypothetical protein
LLARYYRKLTEATHINLAIYKQISMTKRLHFTLGEVLDDVLSDDEDLYDPDEPMMEGSDDDFSDLEGDEDDNDNDSAMDTTGAQGLTILEV